MEKKLEGQDDMTWIHRNGDGVMMLIAMAMVTLRWPGVPEAEVRVVEWTREDTKRERCYVDREFQETLK